MDPGILIKYGERFVDGSLITLKLVALSSLAGIVLALVTALARVSKRRWLWLPAYGYILTRVFNASERRLNRYLMPS